MSTHDKFSEPEGAGVAKWFALWIYHEEARNAAKNKDECMALWLWSLVVILVLSSFLFNSSHPSIVSALKKLILEIAGQRLYRPKFWGK